MVPVPSTRERDAPALVAALRAPENRPRCRATVNSVMPTAAELLDDPAPRTFAELDRATGVPKGSAFRAFKTLLPVLVEGRDFHCCDCRLDDEGCAGWLASGRFYRGTVNAVLLADSGVCAVRELLDGGQSVTSPRA